jgi:hypothetical protein
LSVEFKSQTKSINVGPPPEIEMRIQIRGLIVTYIFTARLDHRFRNIMMEIGISAYNFIIHVKGKLFSPEPAVFSSAV